MQQFVTNLVNISVVVFAVTSMLSVGLTYSVQQIVTPLRNVKAVLLALLANFVLVPLLTYGVIRLFPLDQAMEIGLFLLACAAGAPFLVKLVEAADGDIALSAALLVLLLLATTVYMPLVVPWALPDADMNFWMIAEPLLLQMLLPLAVGLLVKAYWRKLADRTRPVMDKISTITLVVLVLALTLGNLQAIRDILGTGAILATLIILVGSLIIGFLLTRDRRSRIVLSLGTAQRNIAAAMVVASQSIDLPNTIVMVVTFSIVGFLMLFGTAWWMRFRATADGDRKRHAVG